MPDADALMSGLFPPEVLATSSPHVARLADLLPAERPAVADAVALRQRQFATGRVCARELLGRLGQRRIPLPRGRNGAPMWPQGFTGSISHAPDLCVAAVAPLTDVAAVGIDVEENQGLERDLWHSICTKPERAWLDCQPPEQRPRLVRALFSAKECAYKVLSPRLRTAFEPRAFDIRLELELGRFQASAPTGSGAFTGGLIGSIALRERWIFTGMTATVADLATKTRAGENGGP